jgi:hypothetical protein
VPAQEIETLQGSEADISEKLFDNEFIKEKMSLVEV